MYKASATAVNRRTGAAGDGQDGVAGLALTASPADRQLARHAESVAWSVHDVLQEKFPLELAA